MDDLATRYGPWAVIAGGSEGVGAAFARRLAEAGVNLVLLARKEPPLLGTARECEASGVQVRTLSIDLADPSAAQRVVDEVAGLEVGLLVYNAGANTHSAEFLDGDLAAFQRVIDLNVRPLSRSCTRWPARCGTAAAAGSSSSGRSRGTWARCATPCTAG